MSYSSDLSEKEFTILKPHINYQSTTRPRKHDLKRILDGILYQLKNGCIWSDLPKDLPPYSTCFYYYKKWSGDGTLDILLEELHKAERARLGKKTGTKSVNN